MQFCDRFFIAFSKLLIFIAASAMKLSQVFKNRAMQSVYYRA